MNMFNRTILIVILVGSCDSETPGEYRGRIENVACNCVADNKLLQAQRSYPDCNEVGALSKQVRDSLLEFEMAVIDKISACMKESKLSEKDVEHYWNTYDVYKVFECKNDNFKKFYHYAFELRKGCY